MKKSITIFFILIFFTSCDESNNPFTDSRQNIKVKTESQFSLNTTTNAIENKIYEKHYDESGNITSIIYYNKLSEKIAESKYLYKENQKTETYYEFDKNGDTLNILNKNYHLDNSGNIIKIEVFDNGSLETLSELLYNEKGNISEERVVNNEGKIEEKKYEYIYNSKGNLESISIKNDVSGEVIQKDSLIYNRNKLDMISFDTQGKISQIQQYLYDENGFLIKELNLDSNGKIIKQYVYQYTFY